MINYHDLKIEILERLDNGRPLRGTVEMRRSDVMEWELDKAHTAGINLTTEGEAMCRSQDEYLLKGAVKSAIKKHDNIIFAALKRKQTHQEDWPMFPMPKQGQVSQYGTNRRQAYTLPPEEHAFAMDLREAARGGDDFEGMIASIEDAGFILRPVISHNSKEETYRLGGFRFARGDIEMQGSLSRILICEDPDNPRAPVLPRDGAFLMSKKNDYDDVMKPITDEIMALREEIDAIMDAGSNISERAEIFQEAGITPSSKEDEIYNGEDRYRRTRFFMTKDDVTVRIVTPWDPDIARVCRKMIKDGIEKVVEETPEP